MTRPTRLPGLPARAGHAVRRLARKRGFALVVGGLAVACEASPPTAVENLEDLYRARDEQTGTYSDEVIDRGWVNTSGFGFRGLFGEPAPITEVEQLDDPIGFGLKNLAIVCESQGKEFDDYEWARAIASCAEIGRIDPARILRSRGYETAATLWRARRTGDERFEVKPLDEAALTSKLEPLQSLADAGRDQRDSIVEYRGADLLAAATALADARPGSYELGEKLLKLGANAGRALTRTRRGRSLTDVDRELRRACHALAGQVAFLSAMPDLQGLKGAFDWKSEPQISAGRLLLAVDAPAATLELGKVWALNIRRAADPSAPLVRISWLQALADSGLTGAGVHPSLRGPLLSELSSENENAAVRWWTRQALATLLRVDLAATTEAELRAKWLSLGDWDSGARRS